VRENIVVGVSADISIYERQMNRLAAETDRGIGGAARRVEALSTNMVRAQEDMYSKVRALTSDSYAYQEARLDDWSSHSARVTSDLERLNASGAEKYLALEQEKAQASRDFLSGLRQGHLELQEFLVSWAEGGRRVFQTFVSQSATFFEDGLFALLKGRFEDIGDAWQNLVDSMLRSFLGLIGELAAQNLAGALMGSFSGGLGSGLLGSLGAGSLSSFMGGLAESGISLVSGAVEAVGGFFGSLFDQAPEFTSRPAVVFQGGRDLPKSDYKFPVEAVNQTAAGPQQVQVHIHGDTLSDPQTLNRVAVKVGEALARQRRLLLY